MTCPTETCAQRVLVDDYITEIDCTIKEIENGNFFYGRNTSPLTADHKHHLAKLYNTFGFSQDKWLRHLQSPAFPQKTTVNGLVHAMPPDSATDLDTEDIKMIKIRGHSKRPDFVCAMKRTGGCSKCFDTVKELVKWVSATYGNDWQNHFLLNAPTIPAKRKPASATAPSSTPAKQVITPTAAKQTATRHHFHITAAFQHLFSDPTDLPNPNGLHKPTTLHKATSLHCTPKAKN